MPKSSGKTYFVRIQANPTKPAIRYTDQVAKVFCGQRSNMPAYRRRQLETVRRALARWMWRGVTDKVRREVIRNTALQLEPGERFTWNGCVCWIEEVPDEPAT